ncbi:CopG family transcriptional regulator [Bacillus salipaludis]|uniref:CopG family transcriptional regulator n=1 Tax=Bacillus salipaludis TaxID=2547811 RepID=A0A4R5VLS7_9BACI|nr:CopG family transcriptional regulator [Bacillus salipaludis]MDQ6599230.1 hypothetical protein [Bacillus salipaludis]TDK58874.1 CopG family transcriptional regulator [Bacillus salipaludis]
MEKQSKLVNFKMNENDLKVFTDYADKNDLNKSAFIRRAIKNMMEQDNKK